MTAAHRRETVPDISPGALDALIDNGMIAGARAVYDAACERRDRLRAELRGPRGATGDALVLDRELRRAEAQADAAHEALVQTSAEAARPIALLGARMRLDAAARIDAAKAELAAAERLYDDASAVLDHAQGRTWRPPVPVALVQPMRIADAIRVERPRHGLMAERELMATAGLLDPEPPMVAARNAA